MLHKHLIAILLASGAFTASAAVEWLGDVHDFGAFSEDDGDATCRFAMVNLGPDPVALTSVRASCGCTTPSYSRDPIMPGDTAYVDVRYNPIGRPGAFDKKIYVNLSDKSERQTLTIKGSVIGSARTMQARFPVDAGSLKLSNSAVAFGDVAKTRSKSTYFKIYNASPDTLTPGWGQLPPYLRVTATDPVILPGEQNTYVFTVIGDQSPDYGFVSDTLMIQPAPGVEPYPLEVMAMFTEDFSQMTPGQRINAPHVGLETESVDFGTFDPAADKLMARFTITNTGENPLKIRRVYSADRGIELKIDKTTIKKGKKAEVTVTVVPSQLTEEILNSRAVIISNDPDNPVAVVRLVGFPK